MIERSVIVPERYKEVVVDPMAKTREMLFVGAIDNMVQSVTKQMRYSSTHNVCLAARECIAIVAHAAEKEKLDDEAKVAACRAFLHILAICGKLDINVALGALRLHHEDKNKEDTSVSEIQKAP